MSRANVELVRRLFRGFERGELEFDICDPAIEIRNWAEFPVTGPYVGHEGVQRWWDDIADVFENLDWALLEVIDAGGDRVVTVQRFSGRFRLTGIEVDFTWGAVISVRDGKVVSAIGYPSPGRAKKAGGLRPPTIPSS
jgi:ketosteroid isomerase-like protein